MQFDLKFTLEAKENLENLKTIDPKKYRKVCKTLGIIQTNPRHPSLNTHTYKSFSRVNREKVFESYVENRTSAA